MLDSDKISISIRMKNIIRNIILVLILFTAGNCKKFLTTEIVGDYPESQFYTTPQHAVLAINAAYQPLSFSTTRNRLWVFGDVASDDTEKGGDPCEIGRASCRERV